MLRRTLLVFVQVSPKSYELTVEYLQSSGLFRRPADVSWFAEGLLFGVTTPPAEMKGFRSVQDPLTELFIPGMTK